jgi:hypothetical protein
MSEEYGFGSNDSRRYRDNHNVLMQAATIAVIDYNNTHEDIECYLIEGGHEGQLTHPRHIPIFIEDNSIHLYGERDVDNELIAEEIVRKCKKDGLDVKIFYD